MISLRAYQQELRKQFYEAALLHAIILMVLATGGGKCVARGTPILLHDGRTVPVEDVKVGDLLMGPDSRPRRVESLARGQEQMWRVVPVKGDPFVVNESHILSFRVTNNGKGSVHDFGTQKASAGDTVNLSVREYLALTKCQKHLLKAWRTGVDFPDAGPLHPEMPAYMLGLWLGDGSQRDELCTGISKPDTEIRREVEAYAASVGCHVAISEGSSGCPTWRVTTGRKKTANPLREALRSLDLIQNRHVPHAYKCGSRQTRMEVLAGYLDADGCVTHSGCYDAITKVERLADDICFIARSLGFAAYKSKQWKKATNSGHAGDWYWRLSISGDGLDELPVRIPRRRAPHRQQKKDVLRTGIKLEPVGADDYFGFELSGPDRLFLLGDFTVTHNTIVCGSLILDYYNAGERTLFICALDCLIDQTADKLLSLGIPEEDIGYIKAGKPENRRAKVTIASLQTIARRKWFFNYLNDHWSLVVWDEVHEVWNHRLARQLLAEMTTCAHLGLTGTPWRLSKSKSLHLQCDTMIAGPTIAELQEMGFLVKAVYYSLRDAQADTNGIRTIAGDWDLKELSARADDPGLLERMVANWQQLAPGQRTAVFTTSVQHSIHAAEAFERAGVPAAYVDGKTSPKERKRIYKALKDGEILVVCSCQVLSTGFDEPSISCGILARNSKSVSLIWQQLGRVFRISPDTGKTQATILDMAGVLSKIPVPESLTHYQLQEPPSGSGGNGGSMKECPKVEETGCPGLSYGFAKECSCCGAPFPSKHVDHDGSLSRLVIKQNDAAAKAEARLKKKLVSLRKRALKTGKDPMWATKAFFAELRTAPKTAWHLNACYPEPDEAAVQTYALYLTQIMRRRGLDDDWFNARMEEEFGDTIDWHQVLREAEQIAV